MSTVAHIAVVLVKGDIAKALLKFGGWRRVQNTWADNWPTYRVP